MKLFWITLMALTLAACATSSKVITRSIASVPVGALEVMEGKYVELKDPLLQSPHLEISFSDGDKIALRKDYKGKVHLFGVKQGTSQLHLVDTQNGKGVSYTVSVKPKSKRVPAQKKN